MRKFSKIRYSRLFVKLKEFFSYDGKEEQLKRIMNYLSSTNHHEKMPGSYFEFGVYNGGVFVPAYYFAQLEGLDMDFYAFDSFEGLPEIKGVDAEYKQFEKGEFSCSEEEFKQILERKGIDLNVVHTIKGFFDKSLNEKLIKDLKKKNVKASIVYIDSDLYESCVSVLEFLKHFLQEGTIICFDDWFAFRGNKNQGEQRACREWLERNPWIELQEYHKYNWCSNSFIVHIKDNDKSNDI